MMPAFVTGAAVVASIIGTLAFAAGIIWVLGVHRSRHRPPEPIEHFPEGAE